MPIQIESNELSQRVSRVTNVYRNMVDTNQTQVLSDKQLIPFLAKEAEHFKPYPNALAVESQVQEWAKNRNIWDYKDGDNYNTMFSALHPETSNEQHLVVAGKMYALLYYIDDSLGNDTQGEEQQAIISVLKKVLGAVVQNPLAINQDNFQETRQAIASEQLSLENQQEVEKIISAFFDILSEINRTAPKDWLAFFYSCLGNHLQEATTNHDQVLISGSIWHIDEYSQLRIKVAGMNLAEALMEYVTENYRSTHTNFVENDSLPIETFKKQYLDIKGRQVTIADFIEQFTDLYKQLNYSLEDSWLISQISRITQGQQLLVTDLLNLKSFLDLSGASEWNDVMSLWKELYREESIFNIVAVACIQNMDKSIVETLKLVSKLIDTKAQLSKLIDQYIASLLDETTEKDTDFAQGLIYLQTHFKNLYVGHLSSDSWQKNGGRGRYDNPASLIRID